MKADLEDFRKQIASIDDVAELRRMLIKLKKENIEISNRESERLKAEKEASLLYQQMKEERNGLAAENKRLLKENEELKEKLSHTQDQNTLKTNRLFGRKTEKTADLLRAEQNGEETKDPLAEDGMPEDVRAQQTPSSDSDKDAENTEKEKNSENTGDIQKKKKRGKRKTGKREMDLSRLPRCTKYEYDPEELNQIYGEGNWEIRGWHESVKKGYIPAVVYAEVTCTPVLSVGPEKELHCLPPKEMLLPGSDATSDLVAGILNNKFSLHLPLNRQEGEFARFNVNLSRQTMDNWVIYFSKETFFRIYGWMEKLLKQCDCTQSDETTLLVIRDGRTAGRKSFMWVHITSELDSSQPIAVFCYEPDRSAEHLRQFYGEYVGQILCDAYCAYHTFEKEQEGKVIICGCWMHSRRRWADSLRTRSVKGMTKEQIDSLPEVRALRLIGDIYQEDQKLKGESVENRLAGRATHVKEKVDAYFAFLDEFNLEDPQIPEKMRDAISYSLNQKEYLTRFLKSGKIPIDNGACERRIRPLAVGRNSWLFCTSPAGAEATAIMYTVVETAKLNGANVYYYLKYLLEKTPPAALPALSQKAMEDLMPWSEKYKKYEAEQKATIQKMLDSLSDEEPTIKKEKKMMRSGPDFLRRCV